MRIAMIIDAWDPIIGGWQVHVKNLVQKLVENHGCEIDIFVRAVQGDDGIIYDQDEVLLDGKIKVFRCGRARSFFYFPERILSIFSIVFRIIREHGKERYDLIHAHAFLGLLSGKIASLWLKLPIVATVHGANLLDHGKKTFFYYVEKWLLTGIWYTSEITVGSSFLRHQNINKDVVVIPNGINPEEFDAINLLPREDIYKVLFVGRLEWTKGIDVLIEAVKLLQEWHQGLLDKNNVEFHLVGYGYQESDYQKMVERYGLGEYILFKGKKSGQELVREYKESKLFILPSRTEWFGITILEAMMADVPVIATRCWGPEDIIEDGVNWFLVEKENPGALAKVLEKHINKETWDMKRIISAAKVKTLSHYTWEIVSGKTYEKYITLIKAQ